MIERKGKGEGDGLKDDRAEVIIYIALKKKIFQNTDKKFMVFLIEVHCK